MNDHHPVKLLGLVMTGFLLPALVLIGLQFIPATGKPLSYLAAPYHAGILLQLMLLVIAGLALIGEVPRWAIALPLAVWFGGVGYWWFERGNALERMRAKAQPIELAGKTGPIVVTGEGSGVLQLAQSIVLNYAVPEAYAEQAPRKEQFKYSIGSGEDCDLTPVNRRLRQPSQTPGLRAKGECVIREIAAPPSGGVGVALGVFKLPALRNAATLEISSRADAAANKHTIEVVSERAPLPIFLPVAGCWSFDGKERECVLSIAKSPFALNPDGDARRSTTSSLSSGNLNLGILGLGQVNSSAYYVAGALGLKPRPETKAAAAQ